jgi:hypothetical protein
VKHQWHFIAAVVFFSCSTAFLLCCTGASWLWGRGELPLMITLVTALWVLVLVAGMKLGFREGVREAEVEERLKHGLCTDCGYDLRGGGERCPECGALAVKRRPIRE